ncbi:hypothetical protein NAL32_18295 [Chryseobacterium sp. Ch-15]|uniref:Uncharacterized protein n=1 Tax=Chryseobacterium muglaense TaxID=2893752 RepID=A0A9Q3US02_9FLAO|nr:hypothetical protein [Chryseobacterium muglaense]MBD3906586.1 hypothetical protein [Chryseobacterium muglaense]MCC9033542.1 hypothetical protein [Chryseobacterium muglaense]MCM2556340.1 hypothetical protein [Chryseobacterium muglaense]
MKKIAIVFSMVTIIICGWLIIDRLDSLDIASNKNDTYAMIQKNEINKRTDINECEKKIRKNKIDSNREDFRKLSDIAFQTQIISFSIIILQILLIVCLIFKKEK